MNDVNVSQFRAVTHVQPTGPLIHTNTPQLLLSMIHMVAIKIKAIVLGEITWKVRTTYVLLARHYCLEHTSCCTSLGFIQIST